jgi:hypothetical protein
MNGRRTRLGMHAGVAQGERESVMRELRKAICWAYTSMRQVCG